MWMATPYGHHVHDIAGLRELTKVNARLLFREEGPLEVVVTINDHEHPRYTAKVIKANMTKILMTGDRGEFECKALQNLHDTTARELHGRIESCVEEAQRKAQKAADETKVKKTRGEDDDSEESANDQEATIVMDRIKNDPSWRASENGWVSDDWDE